VYKIELIRGYQLKNEKHGVELLCKYSIKFQD